VEVLRGEVGFCFGVRRAVAILSEASLRYRQIVSLGPVVHNRHVVGQLAAKGVVSGTIDDLGRRSSVTPSPDGRVLAVTAHGASPDVFTRAYERGIALVDTTCPTVRKAQGIVESLARSDIPVVIFGDPDHTEIKALAARNRRVLIAEEPLNLKELRGYVGLVSQTTKPLDRYVDFYLRMKELNPGITFGYHETICKSVTRRIRRAKELSKSVELMLVIGDRMSANTKNLLAICSEVGEAHLIENRDEIDEGWLRGRKVIGITSGTSTPMEVIEEVEKYLREFGDGA